MSLFDLAEAHRLDLKRTARRRAAADNAAASSRSTSSAGLLAGLLGLGHGRSGRRETETVERGLDLDLDLDLALEGRPAVLPFPFRHGPTTDSSLAACREPDCPDREVAAG